MYLLNFFNLMHYLVNLSFRAVIVLYFLFSSFFLESRINISQLYLLFFYYLRMHDDFNAAVLGAADGGCFRQFRESCPRVNPDTRARTN